MTLYEDNGRNEGNEGKGGNGGPQPRSLVLCRESDDIYFPCVLPFAPSCVLFGKFKRKRVDIPT